MLPIRLTGEYLFYMIHKGSPLKLSDMLDDFYYDTNINYYRKMRNCIGYARVWRVVYQYFIDSDPGTYYTISFGSLKSANDWLAQKCNWNKTVVQTLLRYEYPEHYQR